MNPNHQQTFAPIVTVWNDRDLEAHVDSIIRDGRTMVRRSSMAIGPYNGFSREQRLDADRKIKVAIEHGLIPKPSTCSVCDCSSGRIDYHGEDYSRPLLVAPICMKCHLALHNRKRAAGYQRSWDRLVKTHGNGSHWFEFLS